MLIVDIISYVRQLLPPSYRNPSTTGMISVLFRPIVHLINEYNAYLSLLQFDIANPVQVLALQHILREYVHPAIRVVDGNFQEIDFRVLVPPALTNEENALLVSLLERYRLHSRRYDISVQANWGPGGAVGGLSWVPGYPRINKTENGWVITYGIQQTGLYWDRLRNETTGQLYVNGQVAFIGGGVFQRVVDTPGVYSIRIGGLQATLVADNDGVICDLSYDTTPVAEVTGINARLKISLYSSRSNIGPFVTRIYNSANGLMGEVNHTVHNGWIDIPRYEDGPYRVETVDRFGCQTPRVNINIGLPLAWSPGFPQVDEDLKIWVSVNQAGTFPVLIELASGGAAPEVDADWTFEAPFQEKGTAAPVLSSGVYRVIVGELETTVTVTGAALTCDLIWNDVAFPSSPSSLQYRLNDGQQELKPILYSGRANLNPFYLEIFKNSNPVAGYSFSAHNTWVPITSLPAGEYQGRVTDKFGCRTPLRTFVVTEEPGGGVTPLNISSVIVNTTAGQYVLSVSFSGGSGLKTIQVVAASGLITSVTGVSVSPRSVTLPSGTPAQTVKVEVSDASGSQEYTGVVLPEAPVSGNIAPYRWSEGFQKYINIQVTGSPGNWLINDLSTFVIPSTHERYYYVGNKRIRQTGPLVNEPWQSDFPLDVVVFFVKKSLNNLNTWIHPKQHGGDWGDPNGGLSLDKADIGAFESFTFTKS